MRQMRTSGFSAIELLVVITIAALLLGWGYPRLATLAQKYRLDGAAWALATTLQKIRLRAIQEGTPFKVVFNPADKTYRVQQDAGSGFEDDGIAHAIEDARLLTVSLSQNTSPVFTTRGILESGTAVRVDLQAPTGGRRQVHLELGGRIYVH